LPRFTIDFPRQNRHRCSVSRSNLLALIATFCLPVNFRIGLYADGSACWFRA
jgi:hypothetical protein